MPFLSDTDVSALRTDLATSLPGTAIISRFTASSDGQGGQAQVWANVGTVTCRLSPLRVVAAGDEEVHGERLTTVESRMLTLPALTDIDVKDRVVTNSTTYEVQSIRAPRSWEVSRRAIVTKID